MGFHELRSVMDTSNPDDCRDPAMKSGSTSPATVRRNPAFLYDRGSALCPGDIYLQEQLSLLNEGGSMRMRRSIPRAMLFGAMAIHWSLAHSRSADAGSGVPHYYVPRPPHHAGGHRWLHRGFHHPKCPCDARGPGQPVILDPNGYMPCDYGMYSGASRDEASLLRLGADGPNSGQPDIIDLFTGNFNGCP